MQKFGPSARFLALVGPFCLALLAACGDSTTEPGLDATVTADAGPPRDAGRDAGRDATSDASALDADAGPTADASEDGGGPDVGPGPDVNQTATIGPGGGEVTAGGATVEVPAGALAADEEIGVAEAALPLALPDGFLARSPAYAFTPHGLSFSSSVTLSLDYQATADSVLRLADPTDTAWTRLNGATFSNGVATVATRTFSFYLVAQYQVATGAVTPLYVNAPNFNDYVQNDGPDFFRASDTPCDTNVGSDPQTIYNECIHSGEHRIVAVTGRSSCAGLSARDDLGAFDWTCEVLGGTATMVSTSFRDGVGLSALIDFAAAAWRQNSVEVLDGELVILRTPPETWWGNPIVVDDDGMTTSTPGTIYLVTEDSAAFYKLTGNGSALVVQPGFQLTGAHVGPNNGRIELGSAFGLYFEGTVTGSGERGIHLQGSHHHLRNIKVSGFNSPIGPARRSRIEDAKLTCLTSSGNGSASFSNGNLLRRIKIANCTNTFMLNGFYNIVEDFFASGGRFAITGPNQIIAGLTVHHSPENGVEIANQGNLVMQVTTIHNLGYGLQASVTTGNRPNRVIGMLSTENRVGGIYLDERTVLRNVGSFANTHVGINFNPFGGLNVFEGAFTTGLNGDQPGNYYTTDPANCFNPGIPAIGDCYGSRATTASGSPNGLLSLGNGQCDYDTNSNVTAPFNPPIRGPGYPLPERAVDDAVNPNDGPDGNSAFANVSNWVDFENFYRGWGSEGSATPSCESQGPCSAASTGPAGCQIFDYRLRNGADLFIVRTPDYPNGDETLTHVFSIVSGGQLGQTQCETFFTHSVFDGAAQNCTVTFLRDSRELLGDMRGNDNLLCESNEVCVYTPNFASYQGEGPLVPASGFVFQDGTIANVTMLARETNGTMMPYRP